MRIIAGKYRGRRLKTPLSNRTRPTSDRLRETLFNVLAPRIEGSRFLDLCAGTGAVGIEALSRGASHVTFVDQSRKVCALILDNLSTLQVERSEFEIVTTKSLEYLRASDDKAPFQIIFFDPPYAENYEDVLNYVGVHVQALLVEDGVMIVEHFKKRALGEAFGELKLFRTLKQGDSVLSFYHPITNI